MGFDVLGLNPLLLQWNSENNNNYDSRNQNNNVQRAGEVAYDTYTYFFYIIYKSCILTKQHY